MSHDKKAKLFLQRDILFDVERHDETTSPLI